jgi:hypothetical protein
MVKIVFVVMYIDKYLALLSIKCTRRKLNPELLELWHWKSDALTTRQDIIHNRLELSTIG